MNQNNRYRIQKSRDLSVKELKIIKSTSERAQKEIVYQNSVKNRELEY